MALNIVSGSEVQTPVGGTQMDSGAFREAALAPGRIAQAIGQDVGGLFSDVSQKIQANRNARTVFNADLAMRKTKDDFTANLAKMPDEGTWLPAWKQQSDSLRESVMSGPHVGPDVRQMLNEKFDVWVAATSAEIRTQALRKGIKDTREDAVADATYAAHQGDLEGAHNILNAAVAHYAMDGADAKKIGSRFPSIAAQAQADTAILSNPIKAPDLIKQFEGVIEPRIMVGVMAKARAARSAAQSENLNGLSEEMDASPDGTIDPKMISAKVKAGEITERGARGLLIRMEQKNINEDKNEANLISADMTDHDFVADKTPEETRKEFSERINAVSNPGLRARLTQRLQNRMEAAQKKGEAEERPVIREQLDFMRQDFHEGTAFVPMTQGKPETKGFFGIGGSEAEPPKHVIGGIKGLSQTYESDPKLLEEDFGKGATLPSVIEAARLNYATKQKQFLDWAHDPKNKDATPEEAAEERKRLERPDVMAAVTSAITPKRRLVRQGGKTYDISTGEEVK